MEEWKDIPEYEGLYQASTMGNIRSVAREVRCKGGTRISPAKMLSPHTMGSGYTTVSVSKHGRRRTVAVHQLVAAAFLGETSTYDRQVNHINRDRADNRPENLEIVSARQNTRHEGVYQNRQFKLTERDVEDVRTALAHGVPNAVLARLLRVDPSHISNIKRGTRYQSLK